MPELSNLSDLQVDFVSLVDRAAVRDPVNQSEPMRFLVWKREGSDDRGTTAVRVAKSAEVLVVKADQRLVYGVVLQPGIPDSQGDTLTAAEIEKAAHEYLVTSRKQDLQHSEQAALIDVVESYVAASDLEVGGRPVLKGAWVMASRINDDAIWAAVQKDEITGYSIGGTAVRTRKSDQHKNEEPNVIDQATQDRIKQLETENTDLKGRLDAAVEKSSTYSWDEAVERATELQKNENYTITREKAIDRVFKADRDLQARYWDEERRGVASRPVAPPPVPVQKAAPVYDELVAKAAELRKHDPQLSEYAAQERVLKNDRDLGARLYAEGL